MHKTKTNYWVDMVIALAFVLSSVSGIVFLFPVNTTRVLGISFAVWDQMHIWASLLMIAGVFAHLVLHFKWIVVMTKKTLFPQNASAHPVTTGGIYVTRRKFLRAAGAGLFTLGAALFGYKSVINA